MSDEERSKAWIKWSGGKRERERERNCAHTYLTMQDDRANVSEAPVIFL